MNDYPTQLRELVLDLMKRGWTQQELAEQCKSTQGVISMYSRGKAPKQGTSQQIADKLLMLQRSDEPLPPPRRKSYEERMKHANRYGRHSRKGSSPEQVQ